MSSRLTVVTRDANNTYSAKAISRPMAPLGLNGKSASSTGGREQAIKALLLKGDPPLRLVGILIECEMYREDGSRTGRIEHDIEVEEI